MSQHPLWLVGCSNCDELWLVDAASATTECPRCSTQYRARTLRKFAEDTDPDALIEQRTAILTSRSDDRAREQYRASVDDALADHDSLEDAAYASFFDAEEFVRRQPGYSGEDARDGRESETTTNPTESSPEEPTTQDAHPGIDPLEQPLPLAASPGITRLPPGGQLEIGTDHVHAGIPPQLTAWVPDVLADLLPTFTAAVAQWTVDQEDLALDQRGRDDIATRLLEELDVAPGTTEIDGDHQAPSEVRAWVRDLVAVTVRALDEDVTVDDVDDSLTRIGTGKGLFNAGRAALRAGPGRLLDVLEVTPQVAVSLDGGAWVGARDGTCERSLDALSAVATGADLRLLFSSPRLERVLLDDHSEWTSTHLTLTVGDDTSRPSADSTSDDQDHALAEEAWDLIRARDWMGTGYTRILGNLPADGATRGDLATDPNVDLSEGSIYRYVDELLEADLVDVDDSTHPHTVVLTELGAAIRPHVDEHGNVQNPLQDRLTQSPNRDTSECTPQNCHDRPRDRLSAAEEYLAATGDPEDRGYTRFLGRYAGNSGPREVEPATLHHQVLAARRSEGVTVVEDPNIQEFEDGRVSYLSGGPSFDDEVLSIVEWGNPLGTMARLVGSLLDGRAWSKILRRSRLGSQLENLWGGADAFENALEDVAVFGAQMGWMSEQERSSYRSFRDRLQDVRSSLLAQTGRFNALDEDERSALLAKLIGLFTTATTLYDAAGYDLTINLRLPDVAQLQDDDGRYGRFLQFVQSVVAKQGVYRDENGVHSIYRMQREQRSEKLKRRLGYDIDPSRPGAEMTCSWIVSADRGADGLQEDLEDALSIEDDLVRDRIQEGTEDAAVMDVPVVAGNCREATRSIVEGLALKKGFGPSQRQDLDRLVDVLHAALGTSERAPSPYDVAAVMQALESRDRSDDELSASSLATGIATLPANRIMPSLFEDERPKLSMQKMLRALLASDEPLHRDDLVDASSQGSVDEYLQRLRALDIVERVGCGQYRAYVEPWWASPDPEVVEPRNEEHDSEIAATGLGSGAWHEVLLGAARELGLDPDVETFTCPEFDDVLEALPALRQYEHLLRVFLDDIPDDSPDVVARIGSPPPGADPGQTTLTAATAGD